MNGNVQNGVWISAIAEGENIRHQSDNRDVNSSRL